MSDWDVVLRRVRDRSGIRSGRGARSPPTRREWVTQQARNLLMNLVDHADGLKFLIAIMIVTSRVARIKVMVLLPAP